MIDPKAQHLIDGVDPLDIRKELFKRGNFDFITTSIANNSEGDWEIGEVATHAKQKRALEVLTDSEHNEFLYGGAAGSAKAQPLDAKIYTPFGYKTMGEIKVGDVIKHPRGGNTNVIAIHPQGKKKIYEITFIDGAKTRCCGDHLWQVWYAGSRSKQEKNLGKGKVQTTEMLKDRLHKKPIIPLTVPLEFTLPKGRGVKSWEKLHPYILGVLIGDGSLTKSVELSNGDAEIIERIRELLPDDFKVVDRKQEYAYAIVHRVPKTNDKGYPVNDLLDLIRSMKLNCKSAFKRIPKEFFHAPLWVRRELIRGMMDTDGSASKMGNVSYSSSSKGLAEDMQYILRSIGCKATLTESETTHLNNYKLYIQSADNSELFHLSRKKNRCIGKKFQGGNAEVGRRIISIEEVGYMEAQCITVDALDGLYVTDDFIVTHNSWTGASWIVFSALCYPGTRWFIARNQLGDLIGSVYVTIRKVFAEYGITNYKYNAVKHYIEFPNGSFIDLIEVSYKPSDPMYEDLGSTEYTGGWIEEIGEVHEMAFVVLATRIGRHLNSKYGLTKKLFMTCNPKRNWGKTLFYDKDKNGSLYTENKILLPNGRKRTQRIYLGCLATENPFIDQEYIDGLMSKAYDNKAIYQRLFLGNWDYEDNPYMLCEQEMIDTIFNNDHVKEGKKYLTVDVARYGEDSTVIFVWSGWKIIDMVEIKKSSITEVADIVNLLRRKYSIPKTRCVGDDDGIGGGLNDQTGIRQFKNGSRPIREKGKVPNYRNLQTQCLYKLADKINDGGIWIDCDLSTKQQEMIKEELSQIQSVPTDDGRKLICKSKAQIKQDIGRSPDYRDSILMRMFFDLKKERKGMLGSSKRTRL